MMHELSKVSLDELSGVTGGADDAIAALKRAEQQKVGRNSVDLYGYQTSTTSGVGAEYRRRLNDNVSVFANGQIGTKDSKPDNRVMGGIRFEW
jgi:hypothetical protein